MNVVRRWRKRSRRRTSGSRLVTHLTLRIRVHAARANGREADFPGTSLPTVRVSGLVGVCYEPNNG